MLLLIYLHLLVFTYLHVLLRAGIPYTMSKSGRPVIFTRDPDGNALECQPSYMHDALKK